MLEIELAPDSVTSKLEIGVGLSTHPDPDLAIGEAATRAGHRLGTAVADFALIVTAGGGARDALGVVREALGHVPIAGGATTALLTDQGTLREGAAVITVANAEGAASGVAATAGRHVGEAAQAAARLVLAGWPFRARYPRGLAFAFARHGATDEAQAFLGAWREFMGPKLRTICTLLGSPTVYGRGAATPLVSVACVEAPYASGIGYTDALPLDGVAPAPETLVHGAADAMLTAVKRLEGRPARLALVVSTAARHAALGSAADQEWAAMRSQVDERTPVIGWLAPHVSGYGRGVQPSSAPGALLAVALGDAPKSSEKA